MVVSITQIQFSVNFLLNQSRFVTVVPKYLNCATVSKHLFLPCILVTRQQHIFSFLWSIKQRRTKLNVTMTTGLQSRRLKFATLHPYCIHWWSRTNFLPYYLLRVMWNKFRYQTGFLLSTLRQDSFSTRLAAYFKEERHSKTYFMELKAVSGPQKHSTSERLRLACRQLSIPSLLDLYQPLYMSQRRTIRPTNNLLSACANLKTIEYSGSLCRNLAWCKD
jgi:hypothetical protein